MKAIVGVFGLAALLTACTATTSPSPSGKHSHADLVHRHRGRNGHLSRRHIVGARTVLVR